MPLKQPNLIIFKNLSLIDSLRGGERQLLTTKANGKDKDNNVYIEGKTVVWVYRLSFRRKPESMFAVAVNY
ncbi:MAG: hypothetical protein LBL00_06515 [Endomicrobium sp.]|jgi:hypothetical protein|nr:hypothetical protein [Endomicrobium sp.]